MSVFITASDIQKLIRNGKTELQLDKGARLTDIAREMVSSSGIRIVTSSQETSVPKDTFQNAQASGALQSFPAPQPGWDRPREVSGGAPVMRTSSAQQAAYDLVILNGKCVVPEMGMLQANVCIKNGKIAALTTEKVSGQKTIDARGMYVLPGIIDPHTHLGLANNLEEELATETRSAMLGGVTTIGTYFNQEGSYIPFMADVCRKIGQLSRIDIIPHLAIRTDQQISELPQYSAAGLNSYKVYMCGVKGLYPHQEDGFIIRLMRMMSNLPPQANPILSVHCENTSICDYAEDDMKDLSIETLDDWNETHPNIAEGEAVIRAAYFSKKMDVRTYIVHSSTKEAMSALRKLKHKKLYVETTSPYLTLDTASDIGAYGKMLPPIREEASRLALWDALRDDLIDTIGTDNTVMTSQEKNVAAGMAGAGAGYPTLGTHLSSLMDEGIFRQEVSLETIVPLITMNPAKIFNVYPKKGTIMPGSDADLVLLDLNKAKVADPGKLFSRSDFSLYQGKTLRGWPFATIKGGKIVAWDGAIVDDSVRGTALRH